MYELNAKLGLEFFSKEVNIVTLTNIVFFSNQ